MRRERREARGARVRGGVGTAPVVEHRRRLGLERARRERGRERGVRPPQTEAALPEGEERLGAGREGRPRRRGLQQRAERGPEHVLVAAESVLEEVRRRQRELVPENFGDRFEEAAAADVRPVQERVAGAQQARQPLPLAQRAEGAHGEEERECELPLAQNRGDVAAKVRGGEGLHARRGVGPEEGRRRVDRPREELPEARRVAARPGRARAVARARLVVDGPGPKNDVDGEARALQRRRRNEAREARPGRRVAVGVRREPQARGRGAERPELRFAERRRAPAVRDAPVVCVIDKQKLKRGPAGALVGGVPGLEEHVAGGARDEDALAAGAVAARREGQEVQAGADAAQALEARAELPPRFAAVGTRARAAATHEKASMPNCMPCVVCWTTRAAPPSGSSPARAAPRATAAERELIVVLLAA